MEAANSKVPVPVLFTVIPVPLMTPGELKVLAAFTTLMLMVPLASTAMLPLSLLLVVLVLFVPLSLMVPPSLMVKLFARFRLLPVSCSVPALPMVAVAADVPKLVLLVAFKVPALIFVVVV